MSKHLLSQSIYILLVLDFYSKKFLKNQSIKKNDILEIGIFFGVIDFKLCMQKVFFVTNQDKVCGGFGLSQKIMKKILKLKNKKWKKNIKIQKKINVLEIELLLQALDLGWTSQIKTGN